MPHTQGQEKPIWASWKVADDGRIEVTATYSERGAYVRREMHYGSLDEAAEALGPSFRDVVVRAMDAGSRTGRWRP